MPDFSFYGWGKVEWCETGLGGKLALESESITRRVGMQAEEEGRVALGMGSISLTGLGGRLALALESMTRWVRMQAQEQGQVALRKG